MDGSAAVGCRVIAARHSMSQLRASHVASRVASSSQAGGRRRTRKWAVLRLSLVTHCGYRAGSCLKFPHDGIGQGASAATDPDAESRLALESPGGPTTSGHQVEAAIHRNHPGFPDSCPRAKLALLVSRKEAQNAKTADFGTFARNPLWLLARRLCHVPTRRHQATDAENGCVLKSPGGLTGSGHQAGWCGRIALTGGGSILVAPGEFCRPVTSTWSGANRAHGRVARRAYNAMSKEVIAHVVKRTAWSDSSFVHHQPAPSTKLALTPKSLSALARNGLATMIGKGWLRAFTGFPWRAGSMEGNR